jgi:transketolase
MGAISQSNLNCVGSHAGISIGEDGPSQMGLEDIALFRSIPNATVFYPSDGVSCEYAVELAANRKGICFIRTSRPETKVLYDSKTVFEVGKCLLPKSSPNDKVLVIGCGITLHEALDAAEILSKEKIDIRVLDPFTIKPIDQAAIIKNAKECGGRIITVEDHYAQGGLGEAVMSAVAMERDIIVKVLAVREIPRSGPSKVLMEMFGIGANSIATAVREMVSN